MAQRIITDPYTYPHQYPSQPSFDISVKLNSPNMGWQCPVCGRGNAVWLATCPCYQPETQVVTASDIIIDYTISPITGIDYNPYNPYRPLSSDTATVKG